MISPMKTCFSIMPFDGFEDIDRIISEAARECDLEYVRGDRRHQPGSILPQILRDIRHAAVVGQTLRVTIRTCFTSWELRTRSKGRNGW